MLSDFEPKPAIGKQYRMHDGQTIVVKYHLPEEPDQEEIIGYAFTSNLKDEKETSVSEWNSWDLTELSESINNDGSNDGTEEEFGPQKAEETEASDVPPKQEDSGTSSHINRSERLKTSEGLDSKLHELEEFLKQGPKINAQFFPFDYKVESNDVEENDIIDGYNKTLNEIDNLREQGRQKKSWSINEFLWVCGGLDRDLLRMYPTDWAKKAGMGGTILGTSILATLSMGFAAYSVASIGDHGAWTPIIAAILLGVIWGLVIFNLDRYLVNSMYSDGKSDISWAELKSGLPRIVIAIFLGIVISTPLEMKIFDGKINEYIAAQDKVKGGEKSVLEVNPVLASEKIYLDSLETQARSYRIIYEKAFQDYNSEIKNGNGQRVKGKGPVAVALEASMDAAKTLYENANDNYETRRREYTDKYNSAEAALKSSISFEQGFSRRLEALHEISPLRKEKRDAEGQLVFKKKNGIATDKIEKEFNFLGLARWIIMVMFIILEVLPVFNKMMQENGKYDKMIDLESKTMEKLARAKEANNINILRSGRLARYKSFVLGEKIKNLEDENMEDNSGFTKKEPLREDKSVCDNDNQDIFNEAHALAKAYVINEMRKIFGETAVTMAQHPAKGVDIENDPTKGIKTI